MPKKQFSLGKARRMRRLMTADNRFCIVALDQRAVLARMLAELVELDESQIAFADMLKVKRILVETLSAPASAMLFDPNIATPAALDILPRDTGLLVALEHHIVEETGAGRVTRSIPDWSIEKIQALGADGVKVLIWYHPDAETDICRRQQDYVRSVGQQCKSADMPYVLELLAYTPESIRINSPSADAPNPSSVPVADMPDVVLRSVQEFVKPEYAVDLLKLESPVPSAARNSDTDDAATLRAFVDIGAVCAKADIPWVLLSAGVTTEEFLEQLAYAYQGGAQGFLAGRAIWKAPLKNYPDFACTRESMQQQGAEALARLIALTQQQGNPYQLATADQSSISREGDFAKKYQA